MTSFCISYRDQRSLAALHDLPSDSVASLSEITIFLNVSSCDLHHGTNMSWCLWRSCTAYDTPLDTSPASEELVHEWLRAGEHLMKSLKAASRVQMHFVCDVDDARIAERVIAPFIQNPPLPLAACTIRLGRHPSPTLSELARKAATIATGMQYRAPDGSRPFRFLMLPPEIRQHILTFTDLVTPMCEVEWAPANIHDKTTETEPKGRYFVRYRPCAEHYNGIAEECTPELHNALRLHHCLTPFCRRFHAAACADPANLLSKRCRCWTPPTALFLVCRSTRDDATRVFFKHNRVVVAPDARSYHAALSSTPARLPAAVFLADVLLPQPGALHALRFLELVFPPFGDNERGTGHADFLLEASSAHRDWVRAIGLVKGELCLPALTLRVCFADYLPPGVDSEDFRANVTTAQAGAMIRTYQRVVRPLSALQAGLARFFVDAAWVQSHTGSYHRERMRNWEKPCERTRRLNKACETLVMGPGYDAESKGRNGVRKSQWLEQYFDTLGFM